jgi:hypothetical protein
LAAWLRHGENRNLLLFPKTSPSMPRACLFHPIPTQWLGMRLARLSTMPVAAPQESTSPLPSVPTATGPRARCRKITLGGPVQNVLCTTWCASTGLHMMPPGDRDDREILTSLDEPFPDSNPDVTVFSPSLNWWSPVHVQILAEIDPASDPGSFSMLASQTCVSLPRTPVCASC